MGQIVELDFLPGLYSNATDRSAKNRWKDGNNVRWHNGLPEKIGGWQKLNDTAFTGMCRGVFAWESLTLRPYFAAGTHLKLYVVTGAVFNDITPLRLDDEALGTDPFDMDSGSAEVTVNHTGHGAEVGATVIFSGATAAGGITIDGTYTVDSVTDANSYVITHSAAATSTVSGGGASVTADYEINPGSADTEPNGGWGSGTWGSGTWGTPRTSTSILSKASVWSFDTWGEDLLCCRRDGAIYVWDTSAGTSARATTTGITNAPATNKLIRVGDERILISFGAHDGTSDSPMNIRWSDKENYNQWTPATTNSAGDKLLDRGNEIVGVASIRGGFLVMTDLAAYRMTFIGGDFVYAFQVIAEGEGMIISPNAMVERDGLVYFMGTRGFYVYDGTIRTLDCPVWETVFNQLDPDQGWKVYAGHNEVFNEIWWYYCSTDSTENDRYVLYDYYDNTWSYGNIGRTAWLDSSGLFSTPVGTDENGYLFVHESGVDADGSALSYYLESYDAEIDVGEMFLRVREMIPDYAELAGTHTLTLKSRSYPAGPQSEVSYNFTSSTQKIDVRHERARQLAIRLESSAIGNSFRMAPWRAEVRGHGRR